MSPEVVLLTTSEVAKKLRVGPATVRRWAQEGRIPSVTLPGGTKRYHQADIEALLSKHNGAAA